MPSPLAAKLVAPFRRKLSGYLDRRMDAMLARINHSQAVYCGDHVVLTTIQNGRCIYVDMRDTAVAQGIALGWPYEPHVAATLRAMARPGDIFFDIGANVGYHSLLLADVLANGCHSMHLFEPNPDVFGLLRRTIHGNGLWADVVLNQIALSDRAATAQLSVMEDLWGGATLQSADLLEASAHPWTAMTSVESTYLVPTLTLDEYCREHGVDSIQLMKIDTEGHEEAVFDGMQDVVGRSPDLRVTLEFTFGAYTDSERFWERLSAAFPHRFSIGSRGALQPVGSLDELRSKIPIEYADVLLSMTPV
jgi:FkbM family methyltransferase